MIIRVCIVFVYPAQCVGRFALERPFWAGSGHTCHPYCPLVRSVHVDGVKGRPSPLPADLNEMCIQIPKPPLAKIDKTSIAACVATTADANDITGRLTLFAINTRQILEVSYFMPCANLFEQFPLACPRVRVGGSNSTYKLFSDLDSRAAVLPCSAYLVLVLHQSVSKHLEQS